ncbi:MAG: hypothetical protein WCC45_10605, partial [Paeniglutamicibacter sp.]
MQSNKQQPHGMRIVSGSDSAQPASADTANMAADPEGPGAAGTATATVPNPGPGTAEVPAAQQEHDTETPPLD